jgi:hypothetical protein
MSNTRFDVIVLGRKLGTCEGWDQAGDQTYIFYAFEPASEAELPLGYLQVDFESGILEVSNANDTILVSGDLAKFCASIPRIDGRTTFPDGVNTDILDAEATPSSDDELSVE